MSSRRPRTRPPLLAPLLALLLAPLLALFLTSLGQGAGQDEQSSAFRQSMERAERQLASGDWSGARESIRRAQERDARSIAAFDLRARWGDGAGDLDEALWSRYRGWLLARAQRQPKAELERRRVELLAADPLFAELEKLRQRSIAKLLPLAERYEQERRPHSGIAVHKLILGLDPERQESLEAIERLASAPDPALAAEAKPKDLLAGVSQEWIEAFDRKHGEWKQRAKLERDNYVTQTNAGYEVMVRTAEAMEQMNAFYRSFFRYGTEEHPGSVSRIDVRIFKNRDEYLKLGVGPPVEWSGGHFVGDAVETYIGAGGFEEMTQTLFHEAAHQFVSLATQAAGWLNEGLASFFEGCRILSNGTVLMNLPASGRLFDLAPRMQAGWMTSAKDGIDPENPSASSPTKAPTFRIVLENEYAWGPPWYAPTWGVVYFLYNYQDPEDGRFIYRRAFQEFIDTSGGRQGEGAVENFEEVVLGQPAKPTPGFKFERQVALPRTVAELDSVWKDYILRLRDEQSGQLGAPRPYLAWARNALVRKDLDDAFELFEKGLVADPFDGPLLEEFAQFLHEKRQQSDRAAKLCQAALSLAEREAKLEPARIQRLEKLLAKCDPSRGTLEDAVEQTRASARALVARYLQAGRPSMAMELAYGLGDELATPELDQLYAQALEQKGAGLDIWRLAYNERDLAGWNASELEAWQARGERIRGSAGPFAEQDFTYRFLTLDQVTSGDFSMESEVLIEGGKGAFGGLVFGRKSATAFHALILFPPKAKAGSAGAGFVDLTSFYGSDRFEIWRHSAVDFGAADGDERTASSGAKAHRLRVDVVGNRVDAWFDGEFLASQSFESADVLRGGFGLIAGPGEVHFREVRYLARAARDRASEVERRQRFAALEAAGGTLDGSYLGKRAPFPSAARWFGPALDSYDGLPPGPRLVTLFSIEQHEVLPLSAWLGHLAKTFGPQGLQFVSIASANDAERLEAFLAKQPFPGSVALDAREGFGLGQSFEAFHIDRFNLPRLLLLDLDGTVVWEGDPGFAIGVPWKPGDGSFLDGPLAKLIAERRLETLLPWCQRWREELRPNLCAGRFAPALAGFLEARQHGAAPLPEAIEANRWLELVKTLVDDLESTAEQLAERGADPCLDELLGLAEKLGYSQDPKRLKALRAQRSSEQGTAWKACLADFEAWLKAEQRGKGGDPLALADGIAERPGRLPAELANWIRERAPERARLSKEADGARGLAALWLAREFLGW
jgi:hypothetical protein